MQIKLEQVKETKNLERFISTQLPEDLRDSLHQIAEHYTNEEIRAGNPPSHIQVDNKGRPQPIRTAKRRVVVRFGDTEQLAAAVSEAWTELIDKSPVLTGRYRADHAVYIRRGTKGKPKLFGKGPVAAKRAAESAGPQDTVMLALAPNLPYTRRATHAGGKKGRRTKLIGSYIDEVTGDTVQVKRNFTISRPLNRIIAARLKRRFKNIWVGDPWLVLGNNGRIPMIALGYRYKGRLDWTLRTD